MQNPSTPHPRQNHPLTKLTTRPLTPIQRHGSEGYPKLTQGLGLGNDRKVTANIPA